MPSLSAETILFSTVVLVGLLFAFAVRFRGRWRWGNLGGAVALMTLYFWTAAPSGDHAGLAYLLFGTFFAISLGVGLVAAILLRLFGVSPRASLWGLSLGALVLIIGLAWP